MKELLAILDQMNSRIGTLEEENYGDQKMRECERDIADLRELTSHMPDFAAAFRPQEVSK